MNIKLILFFLSISLLLSCSSNTALNSNDIDDKTERIETLKNQIKTHSEIEDTEFDLFNSSGFGRENLIPALGPTDIYYTYVVKILPGDITKWTKDYVEITGKIEDEKWMSKLVKKRNQNWAVKSHPKFYTEKNTAQTLLIVFESEGIIYYKIDMH